jgi:hypothetical protein
MDLRLLSPDGRRDRKLRRLQPRAGPHHRLAASDVRALSGDKTLRGGSAKDSHRVFLPRRILDRNDRVRARRDRRAGHNGHRLAGLQRLQRFPARGDFTHQPQLGRDRLHVGAANGVTVHQTFIERRIIAIRRQVSRQIKTLGFRQWHTRGCRPDLDGIEDRDGLLDREQIGDVGFRHRRRFSNGAAPQSTCAHKTSVAQSL